MKHHKLVRDNVPEIIRRKGGTPVLHQAHDVEYLEKLKEKLQEEVKEFIEAETIEEMADVLEVIEAICNVKTFHVDELMKIKEKKAEERGKFVKRIILEES